MKLLLGLLLLLLSINDNERGLIVTDDVVMLIVNDKTTKAELEEHKLVLKKSYNIDIEFEKSTFSSAGELVTIVLSVDCNNGATGNLNSSCLDKTKKIGFYKTLKEGASVSLHLGQLPEVKDIK